VSAPHPALAFDRLSKSFGAVQALAGVSFEVRAGSVHALLGENGAGKSTLLRVLSGAHAADAGALRLAGAATSFASPAAAFAAGVAVIYQELHLVPELTVAENLFLGHLPARCGIVKRAVLRERARTLLARVAPEVDPDARVASLALGPRQGVEIAKALSRGARVLAFDEPTSSLSAREADRLFAVIRELRDAGAAILYVTHRLDEVFELCDAATVLRDGRHVRSWDTLAGVERGELVRAMVGRELGDAYGWSARPRGAVRLQVEGLSGPGLRAPASLAIAAGEITGLFGLVGAGRSELLRLLCGAERASGGSLRLDGRPLALRSVRDALAAGVALCPEDRRKEGLFLELSVRENLNLGARDLGARAGLLVSRWERDNAARQIERLGIRCASALSPVRTLSGGNQQKVVLGRWLARELRVLLLDEPTRGVDVGARRELYALLYELAAAGLAILLVSSDLPEVLGVSDRVLVMREGALAAEFTRQDATAERVLAAALPVGSASSDARRASA